MPRKSTSRKPLRLFLGVGLTRVDPKAYDGWDGQCPGTDRDVAGMAKLAHDAGFDGVSTLMTAQATANNVRDAFYSMGARLHSGDLLVLFYSGHGGQQPDTNGDEPDGQDETICLYDGQVADDTIAECLAVLAPGVRVLFISDSCNSGTNYRGMRDVGRSTPVKLSKRATADFRGSLIHMAGCADGRSSYGANKGGDFTLALLAAAKAGKGTLTYRQWSDRAAKAMSRRQVPIWDTWGGTDFSKQVALQ